MRYAVFALFICLSMLLGESLDAKVYPPRAIDNPQPKQKPVYYEWHTMEVHYSWGSYLIEQQQGCDHNGNIITGEHRILKELK